MAWIAVDGDGYGCIYEKKPIRVEYFWRAIESEVVDVSDYAIQLLVGRDLTWEDEPVEVGVLNNLK